MNKKLQVAALLLTALGLALNFWYAPKIMASGAPCYFEVGEVANPNYDPSKQTGLLGDLYNAPTRFQSLQETVRLRNQYCKTNVPELAIRTLGVLLLGGLLFMAAGMLQKTKAQ